MKRIDSTHIMNLVAMAAITALVGACASIGRPSGGDYDIEPPVYVKSNPPSGATNINRNRITIDFNENVQIEDVLNRVVVSPAQKTNPSINALGRRVTIDLRDTLLPATTYTIDFGNSISDLNEKNVLDGFAIDFSTGDNRDTLQISGMVFEARNLEPAQGMLVGVYANPTDTTLTTMPLERIARTNQLGQFTVRGLKPGSYRIYAIGDVNRDYHWDRSENIAFHDINIQPQAQRIVAADTLKTAAGTDSIVDASYTQFTPNDILLTWFNEGYTPQYIKDYSRPDRRRLMLKFSTAADSLPIINLIENGVPSRPVDQWAVVNHTARRDSLEYFITDTALMARDTLNIELRSLLTDTLNRLSLKTDTLKVIFKGARDEKRRADQEAKQRADRRKRAQKTGENIDSIEAAEAVKANYMHLSPKAGSKQEVYLPLQFTVDYPVRTMRPEAMRLLMQRDTLWDTISTPPIARVDSFDLLHYELPIKWTAGAKYRFEADSAALVSIYGNPGERVRHEFNVAKADDYSALYFTVIGVRDSAIVEVVDGGDKLVAEAPLINGTAEFPYLKPGTYYARLYLDRNGNGKWDTGSIADSLQPEEVFYYPKKITLKTNWDVEQTWDIYATPVDLQKPRELVKNKPKAPARRRNKDGTYADDPSSGSQSSNDDDDEPMDNYSIFGPGSKNAVRNNF